jgi:hypothetical protein
VFPLRCTRGLSLFTDLCSQEPVRVLAEFQHAPGPVHLVALVLTSRVICSPQFASVLFVPIPFRFRLILSITQRVPILFQQGAPAVNSYPITCFKYMSSLFYITNALLSSFTLSTDRLPRVIKRDEPKGSFPLAYLISVSLIVHQSRP